MNSLYEIGGTIDIGPNRESQEDFIQFKELDDEHIVCLVADGTGSISEYPKPGPIVGMSILESIERCYSEDKDLFLTNPSLFLKESFIQANKLLGGFKMGSEELFSGYAASVTALLLCDDMKFYAAHCGSTRLWILRNGKLIQRTKDHTKAMDLLNENVIDMETYYVHPDRLVLTSCLGALANPEIQMIKGKYSQNDMFLLSTDGLHYAVRPEYITQIILESPASCDAATKNLVEAATKIEKYPDNCCCMMALKRL